ncbi:MAG TPA: hypothetical protein VES73_02725, partial [Lamprocystis sp. (in: g-proteobacteria)]|nr:hypothetical protein [Lamprocystis sp. (in: g-proteobacteria)]
MGLADTPVAPPSRSHWVGGLALPSCRNAAELHLINPRAPLVLALAIWTACGIAAVWLPSALIAWQALGVLIAGVAAADWLA